METGDGPDSQEGCMKAESISSGLAIALGLVCIPYGLALLISGPLWLLVTLLLGVLCGWLAHVRGLDWRVFGVCGAVACRPADGDVRNRQSRGSFGYSLALCGRLGTGLSLWPDCRKSLVLRVTH